MIELRTLGEIDLRVHGVSPAPVVKHAKRSALFIYLVTADIVVHRRDTLLALFWPELPANRARSALRKALHFIRRAVGDDVLINRSDEEIVVDRSNVRCDATALRSALENHEDEIAVRLYRGEFLAGFYLEGAAEFEHWVEQKRTTFRTEALHALLRYARALEERGRYRQAVVVVREAIKLAPYNETVLREVTGVMTRAGDRAAAIRVCEDFGDTMHRELGDPAAAIEVYEHALGLWSELEDRIRLERTALASRLERLRIA